MFLGGANSYRLDQTERGFAIRLMEHLVVPTFVLDAQARVIVWNRACERLTGVKAEDLLGTSEHWRAFYEARRPCLADLVLAGRYHDIAALYETAGGYGLSDFGVSAENWCFMPTIRQRRYLGIDAGPIYNESGQLIAAVETIRDITSQKEAQTKLENLAAQDGLTGLANRRGFDQRLLEASHGARYDGHPLALLMIDVDCFKLYNDKYGHQMGDECLRRVAKAIEGSLYRMGDFAARYGGEEFSVILPDAMPSGAMLVAERIRSAIEDLAIPHEASTAAKHVTLSVGGAASFYPFVDADRLLKSADEALYLAKSRGRNRIEVVGPKQGACGRRRQIDAGPRTDQ